MINFKKLIILPIMACYMIRGGEAAVPVPGWYDAEGQRQVRILEKKLLGNCKTVAVELIKEDVSTQLHLRRAPGSAQTPIIVDTNGPPSIKEMVPVIIHLHKLKHRMRALTREAQATGRALKGGEGLDFRYVSSREAREGGAPIGGNDPYPLIWSFTGPITSFTLKLNCDHDYQWCGGNGQAGNCYLRVKGPITAGVDTAIDYGDGHYDTYLSKHAELRHIHLAIEIARRKAKHLSGNPQQRATKEVFHTLPVTVGCIMADFLGRGDAGIMRSFWTKDGPYHLFTDYQTEGTPQQKFQRGLEERKVGFTRLLALYTERRGVHGFRDFRDRIREDAVDFFGGVGVYAYVPESDSETYVAPGGGGGAAATAAGGGGGGGVAPAAAAAGEDGVSGAGGGGSASDAAPGAGAAGGGSSSGTSTDVTPADPSGRPQ